MGKRIELLAPAGSPQALHAAVENGADAVYLGGKLFSARQYAENFDLNTLRDEIRYAHARGVNVYLTMNILISDSEMKEALNYAAQVRDAGIDGFIVQDLGLAAALRRAMPDVPLHGSTQMTVYDTAGAKALEDMGFKRVVLARELNLNKISEIVRNTSLEVEIFVHGALCVCYSGQCLMSSVIGGRSGNRGRCAQPCRLPYRLINLKDGKLDTKGRPQKYLLSPKDICSVDFLYEIASSGVSSLKIEGRMKSPEYVATVVRIYRKYLDLAQERVENQRDGRFSPEERDKHDLLQIFNRGGFSSGYLKGKHGADMMSYEKPNNSGIYLGSVLSYDERQKSFDIKLEDRLSNGDAIEIWTGDSESPGGVVSSISMGMLGQGKGKGQNKGLSQVKTAEAGSIVTIGRFTGNIRKGNSVYKTSDAALNKAAYESYAAGDIRKIKIRGQAVLRRGEPLMLNLTDDDGHKAYAAGTVLPEVARSIEISKERLAEQLMKTGGTPFEFSELDIELEGGLSIPVSEINKVRREALERMLELRADRYDRDKIDSCILKEIEDDIIGARTNPSNEEVKARIALYFYKWDKDIDYTAFEADRVYLPWASRNKKGFLESVRNLRSSGVEVFGWVPAVTWDNRENSRDTWEDSLSNVKELGEADGILVGNIGTACRIQKVEGIKLAGDISMNIFNTLSFREAAKLGFDSVALSAEMTMGQIKQLGKLSGVPAVETVVYGRLPVMISEYCPVGCVEGGFGSSSPCSGCCTKGDFVLKDRMGVEFPVLCDNTTCRSTILNSKVLFVPEMLKELTQSGVSILRLYIWDEEPEDIIQLVRLHRGEQTEQTGRIAEKVRGSGFTKGHYVKGV